MMNITSLLVAILAFGIPLIVTLIVRRSVKNEMSFSSRFDSDVSIFYKRPATFQKFMVNVMRNDGQVDLSNLDSKAEREKFDEIPIYFKSSSVQPLIRYEE